MIQEIISSGHFETTRFGRFIPFCTQAQKVETNLEVRQIKNLTTPCFTMGKIAKTLLIVFLRCILYLQNNISGKVSICESPVRLLFDLLHGIKRMDVPLLMVIQFMVLLGYDGQLEMGNSDLEKELFMSAVDQLKE